MKCNKKLKLKPKTETQKLTREEAQELVISQLDESQIKFILNDYLDEETDSDILERLRLEEE